MGLTTKKEQQLKKMPRIESIFSKSKDGRFIVHKTIITTIRPTQYFEKILEEEGSESVDVISGTDLIQESEPV